MPGDGTKRLGDRFGAKAPSAAQLADHLIQLLLDALFHLTVSYQISRAGWASNPPGDDTGSQWLSAIGWGHDDLCDGPPCPGNGHAGGGISSIVVGLSKWWPTLG